MPTDTRMSESAIPISSRRAAPISQKIVCATGIASVRLSPRFDDETTTSSRLRKSKQSMPSASSKEKQAAEAAEQRLRQGVLRVRGEPGVVDRAHFRVPGEQRGERAGVGAGALHPQRERLGADRYVVRVAAASVPPQSRRPFLRSCWTPQSAGGCDL